jgi:hypothetical protein
MGPVAQHGDDRAHLASEMPRPVPSPLAAEGARLAAAAAAALARAVDDRELVGLPSACGVLEEQVGLVGGNAEAADALLAASVPLLRALARAARSTAFDSPGADFEQWSVHAECFSLAVTATYGALAWLCAIQQENRSAAFAPSPVTVAALCAPAAPVLDAAAAYLSRWRAIRRPRGLNEPKNPPLLRVAGALLLNPFPGGERALALVLMAERLLLVAEPAFAATLARNERSAEPALSAADVSRAYADTCDAIGLLEAVLRLDGAERAAAAAFAAATRAAAALLTLLYSRAAAAAEAHGPEVGANELAELVKALATGLHMLADAAGPPPPPARHRRPGRPG